MLLILSLFLFLLDFAQPVYCVQVPWGYINVCGYSNQFCKTYHIPVVSEKIIQFGIKYLKQLEHLQLHNALQHCLHLMALCISKQLLSGWPLINPSSHMAFLSNFTSSWPQLTHARPLASSMHCTLVWGPFYQIWWPQGISEECHLWLTPADPCMTFDPSNALRSG